MSQSKSVLSKFVDLYNDLVVNLFEREIPIELALLALLIQEHLLLLGPPGTAKSMLARSVCERIEGATYFERLLTRFSTPEELFGPLSLRALEQDKYQRITTGTLVQANIAFLDEVFKANSAILNSLLTIINERIYHENNQVLQVPLLSIIGASNETPEEEGLEALYDRFLLRVSIPCIAGDESMRKLLEFEVQSPAANLTLDELQQAQQEVAGIPLSDEAIEAVITIKHDLEAEGIAVSDRRWRSCGKLIKAKAWVEGESQTSSHHCEVLVHSLWTEPSHIRAVERVVAKVANPLSLEAVELEDAAQDLYDQRPQPDHPSLTEALEPLLRQLADIHTRLEQKIASVPDRRSIRAKQALHKVESYHRALSQLALQSLSKLHMAPGAA